MLTHKVYNNRKTFAYFHYWKLVRFNIIEKCVYCYYYHWIQREREKEKNANSKQIFNIYYQSAWVFVYCTFIYIQFKAIICYSSQVRFRQTLRSIGKQNGIINLTKNIALQLREARGDAKKKEREAQTIVRPKIEINFRCSSQFFCSAVKQRFCAVRI